MKVISWNVNGLRAILQRGLIDFIKEEEPDCLCLQEIKATPVDVDASVWPEGYHAVWNPAEKKGYSGTLCLLKGDPQHFQRGIGNPTGDSEGRVITVDWGPYYIVTVYTPNSQNELRRLSFRIRSWEVAFRRYIVSLQAEKPVIVCGDLNVAHEEIDIANPKSNRRNAGFTDEERRAFGRLLSLGLVDTFRHLHPGEPDHYTWWSYRMNARARNVGWRLDYICISESLLPQMEEAIIYKDVKGSDHCPVGLKLQTVTA